MEVSSSSSYYYVRQQLQVQQQQQHQHQHQNLRRTFSAIVLNTQRNANSRKKKMRLNSPSSRQVVAVSVAAASSSEIESPSCELQLVPEQAGGKMVVEIVDAFNQLIPKLDRRRSNSELLFKALKLTIPILRTLPPDEQTGRSPLSVSLSVATIVADLQMGDAHLISGALLFHLFTAGLISISSVRHHLGSPVAILLHQCLRLSKLDQMIDHTSHNTNTNTNTSSSSSSLINFFLTYYDPRTLILHLSLQLDTMRHLHAFPRYQQQSISLQALHVHVPLAHAIGLSHPLSLELEDLSFRFLFPFSYFYLDTWLRSHQTKAAIDVYKDQLSLSLNTDPLLSPMVHTISVYGRYKSRYSTMKKLLRDGRSPQQVHDVLGLRVILSPTSSDLGDKACYRTRDIIKSLWKEMPHRSKDYLSNPKPNGYKSLHMAVDVSDNARSMPLMEIQIRTLEMDMLAAAGSASHSLYKGGLTDPEEATRLKAIMMAAAEVAALRLEDFPSNQRGNPRDEVFSLLDKNGDGRISIGELMEVMEELGAPGDDAREMMKLLDSNSDGSLSSEEFDQFQKQVKFMRKLEDRDDEYKSMLDEKLHLADNSGLIQM